jgi:membrane protease YdiL (CAAX protease family)
MNNRPSSIPFLISIAVLAVVAGICNNAGIKTHIYLWELLVDGKTILLAVLFFALRTPGAWKRGRLNPGEIYTEARNRGVFSWSLSRTIGAFMVPALISGVVIGVGLLLKKVTYADPENGATLLLTVLFDIPAVFIFSVTTVFVEEYIFRGCVLLEYEKAGKPASAFFLPSVLWAVYAVVEVLPLDECSWVSGGLLVLYYVAVGAGASALYSISRSLWVSYSFRIGVMTITPSLLSGVTGVTDAFFSTENIFFFGDGLISSAAMVLIFTAVFALSIKKRRNRVEPVNA